MINNRDLSNIRYKKECGDIMNLRNNMIKLLMNILFYILLFVLIAMLFLPHTSLGFRIELKLPLSLRLNKEEVIIVKGDSLKLFVVGINKRVSFETSDFKVCDVNLNGKIYAKRVGFSIIKAKVDGKVLKCRVTVININKESLKLNVNKTYRLKILGTNKRVSWSSSNKKVVSVNTMGKITGKKVGEATVTGKIKGKLLKCRVVVN